jgi:hypothetical protein
MNGTRLAIMGGIAMIVFGYGYGSSFANQEEGPAIIILSPKDGESVGDTFELKYEVANGSQGSHAHVYLDGQYQKGFKGTFTNVAPGKHEIKVQAADKDHALLPATSVIHVEVK